MRRSDARRGDTDVTTIKVLGLDKDDQRCMDDMIDLAAWFALVIRVGRLVCVIIFK
jgi:hypothetical protein